MKKRRWVLVVAVILSVFIFGGYFSWKITGADQKIKAALLKKVRPFLSDESDIDKVSISLNSISLKGVSFASKNHDFSVKIEEIRLGYRLSNLLRYKFALNKFTHQIVLVHPVVVIHRMQFQKNKIEETEKTLDYREVIRALSSVKRVAVTDAEFLFEDSLRNTVRFAHSLNGWLYSNPADSVVIRLNGNIFGSKSSGNLNVSAVINFITGEYEEVNVKIRESDLAGSTVPFSLLRYIKVNSGSISGEYNLKAKGGRSGYFKIKNGSFSLRNFDMSFDEVNITSLIGDSIIQVFGSADKFCNTSIQLSGEIINILDLNVDLKVDCLNINMEDVVHIVKSDKKIPLFGYGDLSLNLKGPVDDPRVKGNFVCPDFKIMGLDFPDFIIDMDINNQIFSFRGGSIDSTKLDIWLSGNMDMRDSSLASELYLNLKGDFLYTFPNYFAKRINSCRGGVDIHLNGGFKNLSGRGNSKISIVYNNLNKHVYDSDFKYYDNILSFNSRSNGSFELNGFVNKPFQKDVFWKIKIKGVEYPFISLLKDEYRMAVDSLMISADIAGEYRKWNADIIGKRLLSRDSTYVFIGSVRSLKKSDGNENFNFNGTVIDSRGERISLKCLVGLSDSRIKVNKLNIGDFIFMQGEYYFMEDGNIETEVKFKNCPLKDFHSLIPSLKSFNGKLIGDLKVSGSRDSLKVYTDLVIREGIFHDVDNISGRIEAKFINKNIEFCNISLAKDKIDWLKGSAVRVGKDSLKGEFHSEWNEVGNMVRAFTGSDVLSGAGRAEYFVCGTMASLFVRAEILLDNGAVRNVRFDNLSIELVDTLWKKWSIEEGSLTILKGQCYRNDDFKGVVWGVMPHGGYRDSDVSILFEGNILGILPEISSDFKSAHGSGQVFLRFAETDREWFIGSGRFELNDGEVEYLYPFKKLSNLKVKAEIHQGENFVDILKFTGDWNRGKIFLHNEPVNNLKEFLPLVIEKYHLNFGKLKAKTSRKGIRLHVPGIMERGEKGWIAFSGLDSEDEYFIIAGPAQNPLFRGRLNLQDNRLVYPFLKNKEDNIEGSIVNKFNMDIKVVPQKDVYYLKNVKSPLGNFDVNLKMLDDYEGLRIQGCVEWDNLQVWGKLVSVEGIIDVLGHYFRPERINFEYPRGADDPIISGRAYTTVVDSMGMRSKVWLTITTVNEITGLETAGGPWNKIRFNFSTNNPTVSRTDTEVLSFLEDSDVGLKSRAYKALGMQVENMILGPIIKPVEREIRRNLGLDLFHFSYMFSRNIFKTNNADQPFIDPKNLLHQTRLTVGKYLVSGVFMTYTGQIQKGLLVYPEYGFGYKHSLTLEYMIHPDLFLEMEYTYNSLLLSDRREDKRIWIRHVFPF